MKQVSFKNGAATEHFEDFLTDATAASSNLWTAFNATYSDIIQSEVSCSITQEATGTDYGSDSKVVAATNKGVHKVEPNYLPFLQRGCKYAGVLTSLTDADLELFSYQYITLQSGKFFVWGIANSTETDFYTPRITGAGVVSVLFQ